MSVYYVAGLPYSDELFHHGIKNQKWGVRRFQYLNGTLTPAGKERYSNKIASSGKSNDEVLDRNPKLKKALKIAGIAAAAGLTAYGMYKLGQSGAFKSVVNVTKEYGSNVNQDLRARSRMLKDAAQARFMKTQELDAKIGELSKRIELMNKTKEALTMSGDPNKDMAIKAGQKVISSALTGAAAYIGYSALSKRFNREQAAQYAFPNPNKKKN